MSDILRGIGDALAHARLSLIVLALALHITGLVITGERWRVVIAALGTRLRLHRTILINLAGVFVRNATPTTGLGGDASRIALLRAEGVPLAQATASFAYVRLAELPPIALVVILAGPAFRTAVSRSGTGVTGALIIVAGLSLAAGAAWLARHRLRAQAVALWAHTKHLRIDRMSAGLAVGYAALDQVEGLARQIIVAAAFGVSLTIQQSATITALAIAGGLVPTVGSLGAIDGGMVAGLMLSGADAQTAVAITIAGRAISYGFSTAIGAVALTILGGRGVLRAVSRVSERPAT